MIDKYDCIKCEFKRLGLTNKAVADILDISVQNLDYLIVTDYLLNANHNFNASFKYTFSIVTDYRLNANHNMAVLVITSV